MPKQRKDDSDKRQALVAKRAAEAVAAGNQAVRKRTETCNRIGVALVYENRARLGSSFDAATLRKLTAS